MDVQRAAEREGRNDRDGRQDAGDENNGWKAAEAAGGGGGWMTRRNQRREQQHKAQSEEGGFRPRDWKLGTAR